MSDQWTFGELYGFEEELLTFIPQPVIAVIIAQERLKDIDNSPKKLIYNDKLFTSNSVLQRIY